MAAAIFCPRPTRLDGFARDFAAPLATELGGSCRPADFATFAPQGNGGWILLGYGHDSLYLSDQELTST
ncbi:MAG: hypothetical protein WCB12_08880 [Bryobacteraceae bacterium]